MSNFPQQYELLNKYLYPMSPLRTPLIGQDDLLFSMESALYKKSMSNIILIGEAGQGKSALAQYFAQKNKDVLVMYEVSLATLNGENKSLATRLKRLLDELIDFKSHAPANHKDIVLFFDEIHQLTEYSSEVVGAIKPKLARGAEYGIHIIGATTNMEYIKFIKPDPALTTRFQLINIPEYSRDTLFEILKSQLPEYKIPETPNNLAMLYDILDYANLAMPADSEPRKSLDILDTMYGRIRASRHRNQPIKFDRDLLSDVIYEKSWYRINFNIDATNMFENISKRVYDQTAAVSILSDYAFASILNIQNKHRPRGSFLFVGPTGVGKTELAKTFKNVLFGTDTRIARYDMGEYSTKDSVKLFQSRLTDSALAIGTPVILLDEIEKAHPDISTLLYAVLDEAKMSDSYGREISFANHFIIMTTNIGEDSLGNYSDRNFKTEDLAETIKQMEKTISEDLKNAVNFPQAFLGRISAIIPFIPLTQETLRKIAIRSLQDMQSRIELAQPIKLHLETQALLNFILNEKADLDSSAGGARQIDKIIEQQIRNKIAKPIVLNPKLNRFHITMAGDTRESDERRNYSKAYIKVFERSVNESEILAKLSELLNEMSKLNIQMRLDKEGFMKTFTVDPVDYSTKSSHQVDQTEICMSLLSVWIADIHRAAYNTPNIRGIATIFENNTMTGKPYTLRTV